MRLLLMLFLGLNITTASSHPVTSRPVSCTPTTDENGHPIVPDCFYGKPEPVYHIHIKSGIEEYFCRITQEKFGMVYEQRILCEKLVSQERQ